VVGQFDLLAPNVNEKNIVIIILEHLGFTLMDGTSKVPFILFKQTPKVLYKVERHFESSFQQHHYSKKSSY